MSYSQYSSKRATEPTLERFRKSAISTSTNSLDSHLELHKQTAEEQQEENQKNTRNSQSKFQTNSKTTD